MSAPGMRHFDHNWQIVDGAATNWRRRRSDRYQNKEMIAAGRIAEMETPERVAANQQFREAAELRRSAARLKLERPPLDLMAPIADERTLGARDFLGVEFLEMAMAVGRFVGRIHIRERPAVTAGFGTGFVVSRRLLLTNNHVLPDAATARHSEVEFDYQKDRFGRPLAVVTHGLDPDAFFLTDQRLDFALVAIRESSLSASPLKPYTWIRLRAASGKALIGDPLNIIQHPRGEMKQLVLRSNRLVDVFDDFLHYETDTEPGSSGSPVFSDYWDAVGLHHSGVPKTDEAGNYLDVDGNRWVAGRDDPDRLDWVANEGVRMSSILKFVENASLDTAAKKELRRQLLEEEPPHPLERIASRPTETPAASGAVSVTIPLHITVHLGMPVLPGAAASPIQPAVLLGASVSPTATEPTVRQAPTAPEPADEEKTVIAKARQAVGDHPDVLSVKVGYVFENGWITDRRAIVVTLRPDRRAGLPFEKTRKEFPADIAGWPVQVVPPSIEDLVRISRGSATAEAVFRESSLAVQEITYTPPAGASLAAVSEEMEVVAHASPDTGWPLLKTFLGKTQRHLVIGMYDLGAPHIVKALAALAKKAAFKNLTLVMQKGESVGSGTKVDDLTDQAVVDQLTKQLKKRFANAWVRIGSVNGWVSSSYHIKVAVRDSKAFWLSSGNWQSSNQPEATPLAENPQRRTWLTQYNRDWHTIVSHAGLARAFERHILHDFSSNVGAPDVDELALPDLLIPEAFFAPSLLEATLPFQYFEPFRDKRVFTVRPLLTPDNYHEYVLDLIEGAQDELLIQNQTFKAPQPAHKRLRELVGAVLKKQKAGLDVRIIFRVLNTTDARNNLEALKDFGFDMSAFKIQKNCHTKGIIADRQRVLIGSQNWSNDGVSLNRDASLLFDDAYLAEYFATIFEHDWRGLARQNIGGDASPFELVVAGTETPEGMVRLTSKDYMEML